MKTCGDFGGLRHDGTPCARRVIDGPCDGHQVDRAEKKALFLDEYESSCATMDAAAATIGINSRTTIWRWRQDDPEFDAAVRKIQEGDLEKRRLMLLEDSVFEQIRSGKAPGVVTIFTLVNMSRRVDPSRWVDLRHVRLAGADGGPIRSESVDIDPADLTVEELERVVAGEPVLKVLAETRAPKKPGGAPPAPDGPAPEA